MPNGTLEVIVAEGRHLKDKDTIGQSDPFVEIYTDKKYKQRTTTLQNTHDPVWNERFVFNIHDKDDTIHFDVYDSDVGDKDSIGNGKVKLKNVFDDGKFDDWVKLPAHLGLSSHGELHIIMNFTVCSFRLVHTRPHRFPLFSHPNRRPRPHNHPNNFRFSLLY